MKKVFLSLTFLSSFSLLAYADSSDISFGETAIFLGGISGLVLWFFAFWGIYLVFKDKKDAAKEKFKTALIALTISIPLTFVGVGMEDSSGTKNEKSSYDNGTSTELSNELQPYYNKGYEYGYSFGFSDISAGSVSASAKICFTDEYGAPSTELQKKQYKKFLEGFADGNKKGKQE